MNKFIGSLVAMAALAGAASAAESSYKGITFGISAVEITDHSSALSDGKKFKDTGFNLGWESIGTYNNGFVFGLGTNVGYTSMVLGVNGDTPIYSLETNIKAGYSPMPKLIGYGIAGLHVQYIDYNVDPTFGYGIDYGVGAEYKVLDNMAVGLEWKTVSVDAAGNSRDLKYDYETTGIVFKYIF